MAKKKVFHVIYNFFFFFIFVAKTRATKRKKKRARLIFSVPHTGSVSYELIPAARWSAISAAVWIYCDVIYQASLPCKNHFSISAISASSSATRALTLLLPPPAWPIEFSRYVTRAFCLISPLLCILHLKLYLVGIIFFFSFFLFRLFYGKN